MSVLMWGIFVPIFVGSFFLAWTFFPKFISRHEQYHKSEADVLFKRFAQSIAFAVIVCALLSSIGKDKPNQTSTSTEATSLETTTELQAQSQGNDGNEMSPPTPQYEDNTENQSESAPMVALAEPVPNLQSIEIENAANSAAQSNQNYMDRSQMYSSNISPPNNVINPLNDTRPIHSDESAINPLNDTRPIH